MHVLVLHDSVDIYDYRLIIDDYRLLIDVNQEQDCQ